VIDFARETMGDESNRAIIDAWGEAHLAGDRDAVRRLAHEDYILDWPQSGEQMRGIDAAIVVDEGYPGGLPAAALERVNGSEDRWVVDAMMTPRRIVGRGDLWTAEISLRYPSGEVWYLVSLIELRDGRVVRETQYFSPKIDPPAWRDGLTERTNATPDP
jgi:hypothetical protein